MSDSPRKPYKSPKLTKLTPEQAQILLSDRASEGDENAKELLELIHLEPPVKTRAV